MLKILSLLTGAVLLVFISVWIYNWYMGKTSPSVADVPERKEGEVTAYFAGGCFWCIESDYEKLPEVKDAVSGYMGGDLSNPSYNQVAGGETTHRETVKVTYYPDKTTYRNLVLYLLKHTDPTDSGGSFYDRGRQYTSAIYYQTEEEKSIAEDAIKELEERKVFDKPIVTSIEKAGEFWIAEDYHQDYYKKSSFNYKRYRKGSGRDAFIESAWGDGKNDDLFKKETMSKNKWVNFNKPDDATLKSILTPLQYDVTQKEGTEKPHENEYNKTMEEGIYVDVVSGEPLFSSTDKFISKSGWPSFLKPIDYNFVTENDDYKLIIRRTEIRSAIADSHLGHIILDGPAENDKIRYCMNSAALHFVPRDKMEADGYGDFLYLFE
jgi:peptide methionine sulfoxide reductase msrA/msrB